jgi:CheY-like chemotaxis protein|tara:strand:- start:799 stop:1236 length:438 start_codon:yes stop_codon:yes gene_type:complete
LGFTHQNGAGMPLDKILHVEDDESIRVIVEMALVDISGLTLVSCEGGHEAISQLAHFTPDLILLDAMMPGMDGLQTLHEIRKNAHCVNIPVVFMTARIQHTEKQEYLDAGAVDVIEKPFDAMSLGDSLERIYQAHLASAKINHPE